LKILAIDTSCDDTSCSVVEDLRILSNVISGQDNIHEKWGGVVPDLARNAHKENIDNCIKEALKRARVKIREVDYFAVTIGPGLAIALEVGIKKAKELSAEYKKPLIPANHLRGHFYSCFAENKFGTNKRYFGRDARYFVQKNMPRKTIEFPILALLVSGGHTEIIWSEKEESFEVLGETLDDSAGEAFDKSSRLIGFSGLNGGKIIEEFAKNGNPNFLNLPRPLSKEESLDFSFSGLKTSIFYKIKTMGNKEIAKNIGDISASIQEAINDSLAIKVRKALEKYKPKSFLLSGGVSANQSLRKKIRKVLGRKIPFFVPFSKKLCTDNAAMIGIAAFFYVKSGGKTYKVGEFENMDRVPRLKIDQCPS